jgi:hypothetical protein
MTDIEQGHKSQVQNIEYMEHSEPKGDENVVVVAQDTQSRMRRKV